MHDWSRLVDGEFHDFQVSWIHELRRALNTGLVPADHYAAVEQHVNGYVPDVTTFRAGPEPNRVVANGGVLLREPSMQPTVETGGVRYRRQNRLICVRHEDGSRLVGVIEVVAPGHKSSRDQLKAVVSRVTGLLNRGVNLLVLDAIAPGRLDPKGLHGAVWEELTGDELPAPAKPLTMVSYQSGDNVRAFVQEVSPGDRLDDLPVFLTTGCIELPMEAIYRSAFEVIGYPVRNALNAPS